jgi:hypothetical protein
MKMSRNEFGVSAILAFAFGLSTLLFSATWGVWPFLTVGRHLWYSSFPCSEYAGVADLAAGWRQVPQRARLARVTAIPNGDTGETYFVDATGEDGIALRAVWDQSREKSARGILLDEFRNRSTTLTREAGWKEFSSLSDNPEYDAMKKMFLTDGRDFLDEQRERELRLVEEYGESSVNPFAYIVLFLAKANEYKRPFLRIEDDALAAAEEEENRRLLQRVDRFFTEHFSDRPGVYVVGGTYGSNSSYELGVYTDVEGLVSVVEVGHHQRDVHPCCFVPHPRGAQVPRE